MSNLTLPEEAPAGGAESTVTSRSFISNYLTIVNQSRLHDILYYTSFLLLSVLLISPLWAVTYLPFGDLPDHAAQLRTLLDFQQYKDDYRINWFTPYWVGYGITLFFCLFFSVMTSLKIVLSLAFLAYPLASAWLIHELKGNRFWVWSAFPCAWGFSAYWGFLSFTVAVPIAIAFIALAVRYAQAKPGWRIVAAVAGFSILLFFAHALAWGIALVIACTVLFIYNDLERTKLKAWAFLAALPVVMIWMAVSSDGDSVESGHYLEHLVRKVGDIWNAFARDFVELKKNGLWPRTKELLSYSIGKPSLLDYAFLGFLSVLWPKIIGAKFSRNWRRWLPFVIIATAYFLVPYWIFDTAYVYFRFAAFLVPLAYFIYKTPESNEEEVLPLKKQLWRQGYYVAALLVVAGMLTTIGSLMGSFKQNDADFKAILDKMEPEKRVMVMIFNNESRMKFSPAYMHFGKYYQAEKMGEVLPSFAHDKHADNVPIRYKRTFARTPSTWEPREFNWRKHHGASYDYFLVRSNRDRRYLFRDTQGAVGLIAHSGEWYVYGKKELHKNDLAVEDAEK